MLSLACCMNKSAYYLKSAKNFTNDKEWINFSLLKKFMETSSSQEADKQVLIQFVALSLCIIVKTHFGHRSPKWVGDMQINIFS